jgi:hypothetical protein
VDLSSDQHSMRVMPVISTACQSVCMHTSGWQSVMCRAVMLCGRTLGWLGCLKEGQKEQVAECGQHSSCSCTRVFWEGGRGGGC